MNDSPRPPAERDLTTVVGCFLVLTKNGKLDAVDTLTISPDFDHYQLTPAGLNLRILSPLLGRVQRSNLLVSVARGDDTRTQFLMTISLGAKRRTVDAVGDVEEIITRSLDNDSLPLLVEAELDRALTAAAADPGRTRVQIPLYSVAVRQHLPQALAAGVRRLAIAHIRAAAPKSTSLRSEVVEVRTALRDTVLHDYMMKCVWLNRKVSQLGNLQHGGRGVEFRPFDTESKEITEFLCALEKDPYGDFLLDFREFADVLPTPRRDNPWLGPTVHVFKPDFRQEHALDEHYSLYEGFRALCTIGAPVLIYDGQNPLLEPTSIRFLKVSDRSLNLLQGRILEGDLLREEVRAFTAQDLVWRS